MVVCKVIFLGWLLSLFMGYFFLSTLPLLESSVWMSVVSICLLALSGIAAVFLTFMLFTAKYD